MAARPNIVVILADDQGWGDLSIHGNTNLTTPNIDSLARDGALFDRFYVCPVCSPTRAEFLTGPLSSARRRVRRDRPAANGSTSTRRPSPTRSRPPATPRGAFGKWHNGTQYPYHPNARGFDEYYGFCSGHWGEYFDPPLEHNGRLVRGKGYITDDLTDHAMAFIEAESRPAVLLLPALQHAPFADAGAGPLLRQVRECGPEACATQGPSRKTSPSRAPRWRCARTSTGTWAACSTRLDELKLADNTIVLYFSDNGPNSWRWNGGMKGRKGSTDEGGVRAPLLRSAGPATSGRERRSRRSPARSTCCRRWPTWPAIPVASAASRWTA